MRWRIGLGEDRGLGGSQVESVRAVASSPPTHPCYSLPFRATDPNWVWSSDWQAGQTITWTTDEANLFTHTYKYHGIIKNDAARMKVTPPLAVAPLAQEDDMRWNPNDDGINMYP